MRKFFIRACLGMVLIYGINEFMVSQGIALHVGMNAISFLTSGSLGLPGVALLYGIIAFNFL